MRAGVTFLSSISRWRRILGPPSFESLKNKSRARLQQCMGKKRKKDYNIKSVSSCVRGGSLSGARVGLRWIVTWKFIPIVFDSYSFINP